MITKLVLDHIQSPTFDGVSFGEVGQYEKLVGHAWGELDPESSLNAVITALVLAPRNARGKIEYAVDMYILKPIDTTRGNKVLTFGRFNFAIAPSLPAFFLGHNEKERAAHCTPWATRSACVY